MGAKLCPSQSISKMGLVEWIQQISILVKKLADMVGKQDKTPQLNIFDTPLESFINLEYELCILSGQIDWDSIEKKFSVYYSEIGHPSVPIRRIIRLLLLKHIYNLSDEAIVDRWIENPYWQFFSGKKFSFNVFFNSD